MAKNNTLKNNELLNQILEGLREVKAEDVVVMELKGLPNTITDYFVIAQANSDKHAEALSRSVEKFTELNLNESPRHIEGRENASWILMDYFDVVVHIFLEEERKFYALEELWADAPVLEVA